MTIYFFVREKLKLKNIDIFISLPKRKQTNNKQMDRSWTLKGNGITTRDVIVIGPLQKPTAEDFSYVFSARKKGQLIRQLTDGANNAIYNTRNGDNVLPIKSRSCRSRPKKIPNAHPRYKNGFFIESIGPNRWRFYSYTVENEEHVMNFRTVVDDDGRMLEDGTINHFVSGIANLPTKDGQDYIDQHLNELFEQKQNGQFKWDEVN